MGVRLIQIHQCLADPTRLRLIHLLFAGPLCVCHLQGILEQPQAKISKHLAYLRARGLVERARHGNWMVYSLPAAPSPTLAAAFAALRQGAAHEALLQDDLTKLASLDLDCSPVTAPQRNHLIK